MKPFVTYLDNGVDGHGHRGFALLVFPAYSSFGLVDKQIAQVNIINPGKPSVFLCFQLCHICGISWMDHNTVPRVPRILAVTGMLVWGAMATFERRNERENTQMVKQA